MDHYISESTTTYKHLTNININNDGTIISSPSQLTKRSRISLPLVTRNFTYSRSHLRFIFQRPPEFKHNNIISFSSWKQFQQAIDNVVIQTTFWNRNLVMFIMFLGMFTLFYLYKSGMKHLLCWFAKDEGVCDVLQAGVCSLYNYQNNQDQCDLYGGWLIGYFGLTLLLSFLTMITMMKYRFHSMNVRIDELARKEVNDICIQFSEMLFRTKGYVVAFDGVEQKVVFQALDSTTEHNNHR